MSDQSTEMDALAIAGGPAFPQPCTQDGYAPNSSFQMAGGGLTTRDYFAALAMAARATGSYSEWSDLAKDAYEIADAMLKARSAP